MPSHHSTTLLRSLERTAESLTRGRDGDRYLDYGIEIRTVRQDAAGVQPSPGLPPLLEVCDPVRFGGRLDTLTGKIIGPATRYRVWLVGERQRSILLAEDGPQHRLLYSAEGGGKTVLMAQWLILQVVLLTVGGERGAIGATAPTHARLGTLIQGCCDLVPVQGAREKRAGAWGTLYTDASEIVWASGHVTQFRSTQRQSGAAGSPVQGYTWVRAAMDEAQDSVEQGAYPDIVARLRGARRARIMATATAKDSPTWRNWRDALSSAWSVERLRFDETPFVWPEHWAMMRKECSEREWKRRGLALDVGPERQTYHTWERAEGLRPVPQIGIEDVTSDVLAPWGHHTLLIGHDPGQIADVSVMLKAYRLHGDREILWWVVDELTTYGTTTQQHAAKLVERIRDRWGCNLLDRHGRPTTGRTALVRADPYSDSGADASRPDRSVYTTFKQFGIKILPAALKPAADAIKVDRVPKNARIEMVCRLLCDASGRRRLFIATDDRGAPVAPQLVNAIETQERTLDGAAEAQRKDKHDTSHWTAALGYGLWAIERPRLRDVG